MIKKFEFFIGSLIIASMLNLFILVALKFLYQGAWIYSFIPFSFLVTTFFVYKMLINSDRANSDSNMPLNRRIQIKKFELYVELLLYSILFLLLFSLITTVESFSTSAILGLSAVAMAVFFKIRKTIKRKYGVIQELSKT